MTFIQAIHCRSLVPCQDTPSNKVTYGAKVAFLKKKSLTLDMETVPFIYIYINTIWWQITAPHDLTVLMSAIRQGEPVAIGDKKTHCFNQPVPIPSYLCVWTSTPTPLTNQTVYWLFFNSCLDWPSLPEIFNADKLDHAPMFGLNRLCSINLPTNLLMYIYCKTIERLLTAWLCLIQDGSSTKCRRRCVRTLCLGCLWLVGITSVFPFWRNGESVFNVRNSNDDRM